jgi:DNA-binding transcriptional ArsR family regulator
MKEEMPVDRALQVVDRPEQAARLLKPVRVSILRALGAGESAAGVARALSLPRQKVNYHLRELERAGLVELVEERRKGNCTERILRARATSWVIDPAVFGEVAADPASITDRFSSSHLAALAAQTVRDVAGLRRRADDEGRRIATLSLQAEVKFASAGSRREFAEELTRALARLVARYHTPDATGGRTFRVIAGAYPKPARPVHSGAKQEKP